MLKYNCNDHYYDIIRKRIKEIRSIRHLTQEQLAELIDFSTDYVAEIESLKKHKSFSIVLVGRVADVTNKDIRWFFSTDEEEGEGNDKWKSKRNNEQVW